MTAIKFVTFAILLIYASVSDIRKREVSDAISTMIAITALIEVTPTQLPGMLIAAAVITLPQLIIAMLRPGCYGGADIKIMAACTFLLGMGRGLIAIIVGLFTGVVVTIISSLIRKKKLNASIPVVPYLATGSIFAFLL